MAIMDATTQARVRWLRPTPNRLILALLAVEGLVWLGSQNRNSISRHKGP